MRSFSLPRSSSASGRPIIGVRDACFEYPGGVKALDRATIGFAEGRRTAVMGRNGSGKTTLFSLLDGIIRPSSGEVHFRGETLGYDRASLRELRRAVGLVFQDPDSQVFSASVREDVSFGPMNLGVSAEEVRARVEAALADLGVADLADRPVHALSHGQKKRVSIAGVVAMRPQVLVLDEPLAGLDPVGASDLLGILDEMYGAGMTLVLATHDVDFAYEWADDAVVLHEGRVLASGPAADVLADAEVHAALGGSPFVHDVAGCLGLGAASARSGECSAPRGRQELLDAISETRIKEAPDDVA